jgi:hypothetical protein
MRLPFVKIFALLAAGTVCGCETTRPTAVAQVEARPVQSEPQPPVVSATRKPDLMTLVNSVALLDELVNEEKNLSKILFIKSVSPELKQLVEDISQTTGDGATLLKSLKDADPGLQFPGDGLPPGEKAARAGMAKIKAHDLLHTKGAEFELQLLLTQADALDYGTQLALDAGLNDSDPARARQFATLSDQLNQLHERVIAMLRTRQPSTSVG